MAGLSLNWSYLRSAAVGALRRNVVVSVGAVWIAALTVLPGCGDDDDSAAVPSGELLALSYNVAGLPEGISGSSPETNTPLISPLLNAYDLVLVQESWLTPDPNPEAPLRTYHELLVEQVDHPFLSEPLPAPLRQNPDRPTAIVSDGLNRMSRFPFGEVTRRRWQGCDNSAADCLSLKGFSVARTELAPGVCVDVYNLHGEAGNNENDRMLKAMNTRDLVTFIESFSVGRAIILGGDFNMRLARDADASNLNFLTAETGLIDACIDLGIVDEDEIDKFFFRSSDAVTLMPTSCVFEIERFSDSEGVPLSDHDPLAVGFRWSAMVQSNLDCL